MSKELFERYHMTIDEQLPEGYCEQIEHIPTIKDWSEGTSYLLSDYAKVCIPKEEFCIYARKLDKCVKVFPKWDDESYMLGMPGDYLAVSADDLHNVFIEPGYDFLKNYELIKKAVRTT